MRTAELSRARNDIATWGGPIIADRIQDFYFAAFRGEVRKIQPLVVLHRLFWKNLLQGEGGQIARVHSDLVRAADGAGVDRRQLAEVDMTILDELMNVVMTRFHRSPSTASDYGMTLLRTAAILTEARLLAA